MSRFTKECLQNLREKVDLYEVLASHLEMKKIGNTYKALCPFHTEKTPSFQTQVGQEHYHCFGCGAHGDAIAFLMQFMHLSFSEAVEMLAARFGVALERETSTQEAGVKKDLSRYKHVLNETARFYALYLQESKEGKEALLYLKNRGIDTDFINAFQIGLAPKESGISLKFFKEMKFSQKELQEVGLIKGGKAFFTHRITFPILDISANVLGFSARKYVEDTFGGKYVNTPETTLFKKSKTLFGLHYCRPRIVKEKKALIVEGQLDALRLIYHGLNFTVSAQGTAFGEDHAKALKKLGIHQAYIAFDADPAGKEAAYKVGQLLQKEAIEVFVVHLPDEQDPDTIVQKKGIEEFVSYLEKGELFIPFMVHMQEKLFKKKTPASQQKVVDACRKNIMQWNDSVMIYAGLKELAKLLDIPFSMIKPDKLTQSTESRVKKPSVRVQRDLILETNLLQTMMVLVSEEPKLIDWIIENIQATDLQNPLCCKIYSCFVADYQKGVAIDMLSLGMHLDTLEEQEFLETLCKKSVVWQKVESSLQEIMQKILDRNWMAKRDKIDRKIKQQTLCNEDALALLEEYKNISRKIVTKLQKT